MSDGLSNVTNDALLDFMIQYERQRLICDEANGVLRNIVKRAKSEGIETEPTLQASKLRKKDPEAARLYVRSMVRAMAVRNLPVTQEDLFGGWTPEVSEPARQDDDMWDAERKGFLAGRAGIDMMENPYHPPGSELHTAWHLEWQKGQASIAASMNQEGGKVASTRRKRARQPRLDGTERVERRPNGDGAMPAA